LSENAAINKESLTAAGEFSPLTSNATQKESLKSRIEIILTPRLDEIAEMLNEIN
jgi:chemotaxis protein MotB